MNMKSRAVESDGKFYGHFSVQIWARYRLKIYAKSIHSTSTKMIITMFWFCTNFALIVRTFPRVSYRCVSQKKI